MRLLAGHGQMQLQNPAAHYVVGTPGARSHSGNCAVTVCWCVDRAGLQPTLGSVGGFSSCCRSPRILRHASILSGKKSIFTFGNHPSMKIMAEQEMVTHVVRHDAGSVEHHLGPQVESESMALTWS